MAGKFLRLEEAAVRARTSYNCVRHAIERGEITAVRQGRRVLVDAASVDAWRTPQRIEPRARGGRS